MTVELDRLNQFLRYANTVPDVAHLVPALHHGPLASIDVVATSLLRFVSPDTLEIVESAGLPPEFLDRYRQLPVTADLTTPQAVRERVIRTSDIGSVPQHTLGRVDHDEFRTLIFTLKARSFVGVPVLHRGEPIAALSISSSQPAAAVRQHFPLLAAVASIVSLWLRHPDTHLPPPLATVPEQSLALSPRQRQVLLLVGEGATVEQAAVALGFSPSTIKQDLRRAMRATRTSDRAEALERARTFGLL